MPDAQGGRGQHLKMLAILSREIHSGFLAMLKGGIIIRSLGNFIVPRFIFRLNHEFVMRYIYLKESQIESYLESGHLKAFLVLFIQGDPSGSSQPHVDIKTKFAL